MTFKQVKEIFEEFFQTLSENDGTNCPSTYLYYGETIEAVKEQDDNADFSYFEERSGTEKKPLVAVIYSTEGETWHAIHEDAAPGDVSQAFWDCVGEEDQFTTEEGYSELRDKIICATEEGGLHTLQTGRMGNSITR